MSTPARASVGERIAPPRFLLFGAVFVLVAAVASAVGAGARTALLVGFDSAAAVFLGVSVSLLRADANEMRRAARVNDANRVLLLAIAVLLSLVILATIGTLIAGRSTLHGSDIVLIVTTLALAWLFANSVFALHYAHLFYLQGAAGDCRGLDVPGVREPGYWEFVYFSFTLGMTFQTSDITIDGSHMRRVALAHCMVAFLFNMGVLAFAVNALGGL